MPRGGKRSGAGRKRGGIDKITQLKNDLIRSLADDVFKQINKSQAWVDVLTAGDAKVKLQALIYLEDRQHGRPIQSVDLTTKEPLLVTIRHVGK